MVIDMTGASADRRQPRTSPKAERRQQLIDAAMEVIAEHGLSGTTTAMVTRRAGLSMGLVNHHFETKDNLLAEILLHLAEDLRASWLPAYENVALAPAEKLRAMVDALFGKEHCTPVRIRCWFAFFGDAGYRKAYRDTVEPFDTERSRAIRSLCEVLTREGGHEDVDPDALALQIEALADGLWLSMMLYPKEVTREIGRAQVMDLLSRHFPTHFGAVAEARAGRSEPSPCSDTPGSHA